MKMRLEDGSRFSCRNATARGAESTRRATASDGCHIEGNRDCPRRELHRRGIRRQRSRRVGLDSGVAVVVAGLPVPGGSGGAGNG